MFRKFGLTGVLVLMVPISILVSSSNLSTAQPAPEPSLEALEAMALAHEENAEALQTQGQLEAAHIEWLKAAETWGMIAERLEAEAAAETRLFTFPQLIDPFQDFIEYRSGNPGVRFRMKSGNSDFGVTSCRVCFQFQDEVAVLLGFDKDFTRTARLVNRDEQIVNARRLR